MVQVGSKGFTMDRDWSNWSKIDVNASKYCKMLQIESKFIKLNQNDLNSSK